MSGPDPVLRNWEWQHLHAGLDRSLVAIDLGPGDPFAGAAFSTDGLEVLTVSRAGLLERRDARTGQVVSSQPLDGRQVKVVMFSADRSLVVGLHGEGARRIGLWDTASGHPVRTFEPLDADGQAVAISPYGRFIAVGIVSGDQWRTFRGISVWETAGEQPGRPMELGDMTGKYGLANIMYSLSFSPDSTSLVACGSAWGAGRLDFYDPITGKRQRGLGTALHPCVDSTSGSLYSSRKSI